MKIGDRYADVLS
jgi:hypothetical protein